MPCSETIRSRKQKILGKDKEYLESEANKLDLVGIERTCKGKQRWFLVFTKHMKR